MCVWGSVVWDAPVAARYSKKCKNLILIDAAVRVLIPFAVSVRIKKSKIEDLKKKKEGFVCVAMKQVRTG